MGLFSSKKKHHVGTTIQRVVDEDKIVDPFNLAIVESTVSKVDLVDNLLETALQSLPIRANNYYNFVKNNYPQKMPTAEVILDSRFTDAVESLLLAQNPSKSLDLFYVKFGPPNAFHEAWEKMVHTYKLDVVSNTFPEMSTDEKEVFALVNITVELPEAMRTSLLPWQVENWLQQKTPSYTGYSLVFGQVVQAYPANPVSFLGAAPQVRVKYQKKVYQEDPTGEVGWEFTEPEITDMQFVFPLTRLDSDKEFYQALYSLDDERSFLTYEYLSGGYPSLDAAVDLSIPQQKIGQFYPNTYYRLSKAPTPDPVYPKMSKKLDMDYEKIADGINTNEDIDQVESALFSLGIPADTTNPLEARYLFDFFKQVWQKNKSSSWSADDNIGFSETQAQSSVFKHKNAVHITDDVFSYALVYDRIARKIHAGVIGEPGFADITAGVEDRSRTELNPDGDPVNVPYQVKYRLIRKQVSMSLWEELKVYELTMVYTIFQQYMATLGDNDEEVCLVPLDRSVVRTYPIMEQQALLTRSMNFVFNSHVIQTIKWYQTGVFKAILVVVAVAIFIYSGAGAEFIANLTTAATAGAAALLTFLFKTVVVQMAIQLGFKVFVKIVGPEFAFLVALVSMTMGMMKQNFATLNANDLLKLAIGTFDGIGAYLKDAFQDLQAEMDSFTSLKTEQELELERANDLLNPKVHPIAPILLGESPDQFLYRTTVFANSGFTSINDVSSYTEKSLQLPTTGSSFGPL